MAPTATAEPTLGGSGVHVGTERPLTDAEILAQIPAARTRAADAQRHGLRATQARYSTARHQLIIGLTNGTAIAIPADRVAALRGASARALADVAVTPTGAALHWERLDVDLSVAALVREALGGAAVMSVLGAAGGTATSARKADAARVNGAKGGRPPANAVRVAATRAAAPVGAAGAQPKRGR